MKCYKTFVRGHQKLECEIKGWESRLVSVSTDVFGTLPGYAHVLVPAVQVEIFVFL